MNNIVNAESFGLKSNTEELQTKIIQKAIDYCFENGGGEVVIPAGIYHTGDIRLRSNITLHLLEGAQLVGSRNPEDYFNYLNDTVEPLREDQITDAPYVYGLTMKAQTQYIENQEEFRYKRIFGSRWNNALIRAVDAKNIKIIGEKGSVIDGVNCYDEIGEENYRGPHGMTLFNCQDIELRGYTIQNTGNWAHNMVFCDNIKVDGITVLAGHDGLDALVCKNVSIENSEFYTGDDCIAGFGDVNVYVNNCILNSSCSAMRFGGRNVFVRNCNIYGPGKYCFRGRMSKEDKKNSAPSVSGTERNNMLSAFTYYADYSLPIDARPGNIVISDCKIDMADRFLHYNYSGNEAWQKHRPLDDIEFSNVCATNICMPLIAYGDAEDKIDLKLKNVEITLREGHEDIDLIHACNYNRIKLENVSLPNFKGKCIIKKWSDGDIIFDNVKCDVENKVEAADEEFSCYAI